MTRHNQATPYSQGPAESTSSPARSLRGSNSTSVGLQTSTSQSTQPLPHQLPGSRIQMMLNRSRSTNPIPDPAPNPSSTAIGADDLTEFNFEGNHDDDLNLQIHNAIQEQSALEASSNSSQPTGPSANAMSSPTTASTHLSGGRLQLFNRIATRAKLDEESLSLGRFMCTFESQDEQFLACMVSILAVHQEVCSSREDILAAIRSNPSTRQVSSPNAVTWKADGAELKQCMRLIATQTILSAGLQAYTARVDPMGGTDQLPLGLYAKVMSSMLSNPSEWKNRVLPPGYGNNPDPRHTRSLETALNNVLKEVRKSFDEVLLTHINLPNRVQSASTANVPALDTVIVKLHQKERGLIGGRVRVREEILQQVDQQQTSRYAWLRMQAIHWGLNFAEYEGRSFWSVVDRQLSYLRTQTPRYRYAFFLLVLQFDFERIDGKKTFEELKETTDFSLPTETQIQDMINELDSTFGQDVPPDEAAFEDEDVPTATM